jgi:hypothetical protein
MPSWDNFFVAELGASASLTGLLFVGISLNMAKIVANPSLPPRAMKSLGLLVTILMFASLWLIPGQDPRVFGVEVLSVALIAGGFVFYLGVDVRRRSEARYRPAATSELGLVAIIAAFYIAAGIAVLDGSSIGEYLLVPAMMASFLVAILDSWVLLVEINR